VRVRCRPPSEGRGPPRAKPPSLIPSPSRVSHGDQFGIRPNLGLYRFYSGLAYSPGVVAVPETPNAFRQRQTTPELTSNK
jgi:hypothetical protein